MKKWNIFHKRRSQGTRGLLFQGERGDGAFGKGGGGGEEELRGLGGWREGARGREGSWQMKLGAICWNDRRAWLLLFRSAEPYSKQDINLSRCHLKNMEIPSLTDRVMGIKWSESPGTDDSVTFFAPSVMNFLPPTWRSVFFVCVQASESFFGGFDGKVRTIVS